MGAIGPGQRHHHAGRAAGELGGLVEVRRRRRGERSVEPLLEPQRIAAVLVVAAQAAELAVAALAVARDGGVVGDVDLEADGAAAARERRRLRRRQQHRPDAAAAHVRRDGDGIKPRDHRARAKQHDGVADEAAPARCRPAPPAPRRWALEEALQAPSRQPVGGEDAMLERGQRIDIAALGRANAHLRRRGMGKREGHRHRTGKHIDIAFATVRNAQTRRGRPPRAGPPGAPKTRARQHNRRDNRRPQIPPSRPLNPFAARRDQRKNATPTAARSNDPAPSRCNSRIGSNTAASLNHRCIAQPPLHRLNHRCIASTTAARSTPLHRLNHRCIISTKEPSPS